MKEMDDGMSNALPENRKHPSLTENLEPKSLERKPSKH
jgi:hypothetical protein